MKPDIIVCLMISTIDIHQTYIYIYILSTIFHATSPTQPETKMDIPIRILDKNRGKSPPIFPHSSYPQFLLLCARTLLDSPLDASSKRHRCVRETGRAFLSARIQGDWNTIGARLLISLAYFFLPLPLPRRKVRQVQMPAGTYNCRYKEVQRIGGARYRA